VAAADGEYRYASLSSHLIESFAALSAFATVVVVLIVVTQGVLRIAVVVATVVGAALVVVQSFRLEVVVSWEGVRFRNFWRSYSVAWGEVEAIAMGSVMARPAVALVLRNRKVWGIQVSSHTKQTRSEVLEHLRRFAPAAVSTPDPDPLRES
jgi:hypothetical protein